MSQWRKINLRNAGLCAALLLMLPLTASGTVSAEAKPTAQTTINDVIARVGDQPITFSEINTALNSSGIVGVSIPALGTPERDTVRITLLDRFISANLIYLDALAQGTDSNPDYRNAVERFSNAILAGLYRTQILAGDIPVSSEEIETWFSDNVVQDKAELSDALRLQIESRLRREKLHARLEQAAFGLRDDVKVVVYEDNLSMKGDASRTDDIPLAEVNDEIITWGQLGDRIIAAGKGAPLADPLAFEGNARRQALEKEIDLRIMAQKARAAGLDKHSAYSRRMKEYRKTLLTNLHRQQLLRVMEPTNKELGSFYEASRTRFVIPESRKVQMVVLASEAEAAQVRKDIEAGGLTLYEAARDHSIAPGAKQNLGEVGWVNRGELVPELEEEIFTLQPGEVGGPVESPDGWHLVAIQDVQEAQHTDLDLEATRKLVRRAWLKDKLDAYTTDLRKHSVTVEVYQDRLVQLAQQEADMVKALAAKSHVPGSVTEQRIRELNELVGQAR